MMEEVVEATTSARNVVLSLLDEIFENMGNIQADPDQGVVEDIHDSEAKASLVPDSFSESNISSNTDGPRRGQNPRITWVEPKRGRKIQTTSLSLKRRKNNKRRHKHKVLRLRGGGEMDSNDDEDDDDGMNSKQDKSNPDELSTTNEKEVSSRVGDDLQEKQLSSSKQVDPSVKSARKEEPRSRVVEEEERDEEMAVEILDEVCDVSFKILV